MSYVQKTLAPGEGVICSTRLHWIIFVFPVLLLALGLYLSIGLVLNRDLDIPPGIKYGIGFLVLAGALTTLKAYARIATTEIAATTQRFVVKRGLLSRSVMEINAGQLESIRVIQTLFGRIFDYGTIIAGGTGSGLDPVHRVARPLQLRDALNQISAPYSTAEERAWRRGRH